MQKVWEGEDETSSYVSTDNERKYDTDNKKEGEMNEYR